MTKITINLEKLMKASKACADKNDNRYNLEGVYIHDNETHRHYVATNGHLLIHYKEILQPNEERLEKGIIVNVSKVKASKKEVKSHTILEIVNKSVALITTPYSNHTAEIIDGTYPDYERVIPINRVEATEYASFNPNYLKTVWGLLGNQISKPYMLDAQSVALWVDEEKSLEICLMPMRV